MTLSYFSCPACAAVVSGPAVDPPTACERCGASDLEPLADDSAAAYFASELR